MFTASAAAAASERGRSRYKQAKRTLPPLVRTGKRWGGTPTPARVLEINLTRPCFSPFVDFSCALLTGIHVQVLCSTPSIIYTWYERTRYPVVKISACRLAGCPPPTPDPPGSRPRSDIERKPSGCDPPLLSPDVLLAITTRRYSTAVRSGESCSGKSIKKKMGPTFFFRPLLHLQLYDTAVHMIQYYSCCIIRCCVREAPVGCWVTSAVRIISYRYTE